MGLGTELKTIGEDIVKDVEGVLSDVAKALAPILTTAFENAGATLAKAAESGSLSTVGSQLLTVAATALAGGETAAIVTGSADLVGDITSALKSAVAASPAASSAIATVVAATTPQAS